MPSPQSSPDSNSGTTLAELDQVNPDLADEARRRMGWPTRAEREAAAKKATAPVRTASTGQAKEPKPGKRSTKPAKRTSEKAIPGVEFSK